MFTIERRNKISVLLAEKKSILVQETAAIFGVTEETIRRDLKAMENQGLLIKTHGGAVPAEDNFKSEAPIEVRQGINIPGKDAIGKAASLLVKDGDTIILDASSTSLHLAKYLKDKRRLTVITNSIKVILELAGCEDITIISTGGTLRHKSLSQVGKSADTALNNYFANTVFLSCKGFSPERGLFDSNEQEADIKQTMIRCSDKVVFLCDKTKFDKIGYVITARLEDIDYMITDSQIPEEWQPILDASKIGLHIV